ncbi:MAG: alpha/beta hydrolase, partial [Bacteroidetes bacterium]
VLAFLGYAGILVYLMTQETKLVFYETYGKPLRTVPPDSANLKYKCLYLQSEDGVKLSGWVVLSEKDTLASPWLLFCHGNASDISYIDYIARYKLFTTLGLNVLTFDYRGFGESEGTPSEAGLYKDAMATYNYLTITRHIPPDRIIIYGHSLGTGVAIDLATRVPAAGLVVEAGYQSIPEAAHQMYPFLPVRLLRLLVRNKFLSIDKINRISIPKLFIHSSEDKIFAISEGRTLYEKALPPKSFLEIKGSHDSAPMESRESFCNGLLSYLNGTTAQIEIRKP